MFVLSLVSAQFTSYFVRDGKLLAAFNAAAAEHFAALFGTHAFHETVRASAFAFLWLVRSFCRHKVLEFISAVSIHGYAEIVNYFLACKVIHSLVVFLHILSTYVLAWLVFKD